MNETPHQGLSSGRIFLSCASGEFGSYRLRLANQLGALRGAPYQIKTHEDFQQGGRTLLEKLADYIRDSDIVIHIVGDASGARATPEHERTLLRRLGDPESAPLPGHSYTQWEYKLARRLDKKVFVYVATKDAPRDCALPVAQSAEEAEQQRAHVQCARGSGEDRSYFSNSHDLMRKVFRDLKGENLRVNNLKLRSLGTLFKGRAEFLEQIRTTLGEVRHLGHERNPAISARATAAAVCGLGGTGKTRVALEFAHKHEEHYTALLFVTADSPTGLKQNLAALCGPLVLDLAEKHETDVNVRMAAAIHWLQQHPGWFLILDNVDREEAVEAIKALLATLQSAGVETLQLDVLAEDDATDFLMDRTDPKRGKGRDAAPDDAVQARNLARELGGLALALEQAGAYIYELTFSFAEYLTELEKQQRGTLEWFDERLMQYPKSVAVTWQTSFDQLDEPARRLLQRLAWLAPVPGRRLEAGHTLRWRGRSQRCRWGVLLSAERRAMGTTTNSDSQQRKFLELSQLIERPPFKRTREQVSGGGRHHLGYRAHKLEVWGNMAQSNVNRASRSDSSSDRNGRGFLIGTIGIAAVAVGIITRLLIWYSGTAPPTSSEALTRAANATQVVSLAALTIGVALFIKEVFYDARLRRMDQLEAKSLDFLFQFRETVRNAINKIEDLPDPENERKAVEFVNAVRAVRRTARQLVEDSLLLVSYGEYNSYQQKFGSLNALYDEFRKGSQERILNVRLINGIKLLLYEMQHASEQQIVRIYEDSFIKRPGVLDQLESRYSEIERDILELNSQ